MRLLLGAVPEQGLGAELPPLSFETQMGLLTGERDFSRFPPSRAAERLQAVEHWLSLATVEVCRYLKRFLHENAVALRPTSGRTTATRRGIPAG